MEKSKFELSSLASQSRLSEARIFPTLGQIALNAADFEADGPSCSDKYGIQLIPLLPSSLVIYDL